MKLGEAPFFRESDSGGLMVSLWLGETDSTGIALNLKRLLSQEGAVTWLGEGSRRLSARKASSPNGSRRPDALPILQQATTSARPEAPDEASSAALPSLPALLARKVVLALLAVIILYLLTAELVPLLIRK